MGNTSPRIVIERDRLSDNRPVYVARDPALPGCMAHGENVEEAVANLEDARRLYLHDAAPSQPNALVDPGARTHRWSVTFSSSRAVANETLVGR